MSVLSNLFGRLRGMVRPTLSVPVVSFGPNGLQVLHNEALTGLVQTSKDLINEHQNEIESIKNRIDARRMDIALLNSITAHLGNPAAKTA